MLNLDILNRSQNANKGSSRACLSLKWNQQELSHSLTKLAKTAGKNTQMFL